MNMPEYNFENESQPIGIGMGPSACPICGNIVYGWQQPRETFPYELDAIEVDLPVVITQRPDGSTDDICMEHLVLVDSENGEFALEAIYE